MTNAKVDNLVTTLSAVAQRKIQDKVKNCKEVLLPKLPCIPGDEGVGQVVEIGSHVVTADPGERVIFTSRMKGTWRYYGIYNEKDIHPITTNVPIVEASMLAIAPCMAYRMLKDFRPLQHGQTVIQNAANSSCGQCVVQLCKAWGLKTFNIVANHCGYEAVKQNLLSMGADAVHTLEEAEELTSFNTSLTRPVLALNCMGGRFEDVLLKLLDCQGTIVYHGCSFDLPLAKTCLRKDLQFCKFNLLDWDKQATPVQKDVMMNNIIKLIVTGQFKAPMFESLELKSFVQAFRGTAKCDGFSTIKYIFDFTIP
ncbi:enoyl-[acyl-carrier-protein] reductase, mitochondrial-like [Leptidea sinapis]|uniref:enoyl-[acyl-carrier-protein] reductase, mitochondrial-like n=1 Tax=Leptidea sinapis TaxID=189913 RepID=UPI0021C47FB9|nr:enoyl-[acyl-carrier-protein] reductase, mitochondrial-like [Leptidea sinapis]